MSNFEDHRMVGERIQAVPIYARVRDESVEGNPFRWDIRHATDWFDGKRVVLFGLPGAFTPTCSNSQLPGYEELYPEFIAQGIDEVICTSVNDAFVMHQWFQHQGIQNVEFIPDGSGDFANSLRMSCDKRHLGFGDRSWRYAMVVRDSIIEAVFAEDGDQWSHASPAHDPYEVSDPGTVLAYLKRQSL